MSGQVARATPDRRLRRTVIFMKSLQKVNADKLEQWLPVLKTGFPIDHENIKKLFGILKVEVPELKRENYTHDEFIDEIVKPHKDLVVVQVKKDRDIYKIDGATAEIAKTSFNGVEWRTICVEHEDPALVIAIVRKLGMEDAANMNYIQAMKKSVGLA